jgi:hypothetical protein
VPQPELKIINYEDEEELECSKEQHIINYLKSLFAIEEAIEPYKEQRKDLRVEYIENDWLTRDEIWSAVKAFRLYQKAASMNDLNDMFDLIEKQFGTREQ